MNENQKKDVVATFTFKPGGSLKVKGNFIVKDWDGSILVTEDHVKLCRCGKSKTQPFCDKSHRK